MFELTWTLPRLTVNQIRTGTIQEETRLSWFWKENVKQHSSNPPNKGIQNIGKLLRIKIRTDPCRIYNWLIKTNLMPDQKKVNFSSKRDLTRLETILLLYRSCFMSIFNHGTWVTLVWTILCQLGPLHNTHNICFFISLLVNVSSALSSPTCRATDPS